MIYSQYGSNCYQLGGTILILNVLWVMAMVVRMPLLRHNRSCKSLLNALQEVHNRVRQILGRFGGPTILRQQVVDEAECANAEEGPCQITPNGGAIFYSSNRLHPVIDSDAGNSVPSLRGSAVRSKGSSSTPVGVQVEGCHLSCGHGQPLCGDDPPDDLGAAVRGVCCIVCRRCEAAVVEVVVLQGSVVEHHQCAHVHICCCSWCEDCGCRAGGVSSCIKHG